MTELDKYRQEIDEINQMLVGLLAERFEVSAKVAEYKKQNQLPVVDEQREKEMFAKLERLANKYDLSPSFVRKLFQVILTEVYHQEEGIIEG